MTYTRSYDLSITNVEKGKVPELVFRPAFPAHDKVWNLMQRWMYGGEQFSLFPEVSKRYGPGECGRYEVGDEPTFIVRLSPDVSPHDIAKTIQLTLEALDVVAHVIAGGASNRVALAELSLRCDPERDMHGYSTGGFLHEASLTWLATARKRHTKQFYRTLTKDVVAAMRAVWRTTAPEDQREFATDCQFFLDEQGVFTFRCFGNACDMSIYPDQLGHGPLEGNIFLSFDCHNMDWPWQQLTFVAGFAVLFEAMRRGIDDT